jgi:hypothetical protein
MRRGVDGTNTYVSFETISTESPCTYRDSYTAEIEDALEHGLDEPEKGSEKPLLKNPESFPGDHDIKMIVNKVIKSDTRNVSLLQLATAHTLQSWRSIEVFMELGRQRGILSADTKSHRTITYNRMNSTRQNSTASLVYR